MSPKRCARHRPTSTLTRVVHKGWRRDEEVRMTRSTCRRHVTAVAVTALAVAAPLTISSGPAAHAAAAPALALDAGQRSVTLTRYQVDAGNGKKATVVEGDLGVHVVARTRAFEVRAKRASYSKPVVLTVSKPGEDPVLTTARDVTGLPDFWTTRITNAAGKVVEHDTADFCPNGVEPVRRRPDAPASSPYPLGCNANPYTLGGVFGIQAGYAVPALIDNEGFNRLPPGAYTVTITIGSDYQKVLGMVPAQSRTQVAVTLVQGTLEEGPAASAVSAAGALRAGRAAVPAGPSGRRIGPTGSLPDLRSLPAWGISVEGGRYLTFAATVWNAGPGRLVVDGFRTARDPDLMRAYQYFFSASGRQLGYAPVGTMAWDARDGHEHWHFTDFATYRLLGANNTLVARSGKEAFCLANTDVVDYLVPGANWKPSNTDLHDSCGERRSPTIRQVLDTGSGDTYAQYLPGQSFDLRGLRNGTYYIEVRANPARALLERSTANNASYRKVVIGGRTGQRTVTAERVGMVDETRFIGHGEAHPSPAR